MSFAFPELGFLFSKNFEFSYSQLATCFTDFLKKIKLCSEYENINF